ncbi:ABC transporter transmembrane domain-containing protein [Sulfurovum sp. XGS-02]|uniref:ABC transporter ATP-binding protein n=1 Tax=Sulfurovum sp. XGS-02 TaxID=2925411 RepID=UPI0020644DE3|nr:ABC transporter transmembrane domain-containing protein [Sulfurovum sp. XGS-02]UPT78139.1 ABC transporter transmembrane domain-containing protein [Sulfurovum sp. XGS-02]
MKDLLRQYLPYLSGYKRQFFFAILGMIAVAVGTAATAQLIKPVLDDVFINKDREMLLLMPFFLVGVFALKGLGRYIQTYYTSYIGQDVVRKLRDQLVSHLTYLDMEFFRKTHSGEILSRVTNDIARIQMVVANIIPDLIRETLTILALTGYVIYQNPKLAFYFLVIMPLAVFPLSRLAKKMRKYSKLSQESTADMTTRLNEIFSNIEVIKSNSSQMYEEERFKKDNQSVFRFLMKQVKTNALTSPLMETLGSVAIGIVIYIGGKEVIDGHMTVGSFFAFATALFMLYDPVKRLSSLYNKAQDAITANTRMHELLDTKPAVISGKDELTENIETITLENVSLQYDETPALKHITLHAQKGDSIALVGDSGAGKSSLVNLLVRFYDPSEGKIFINGKENKDFTLTSLHQKIAYVTQRIYIFNDSIAANVAYGEEIDETRVIKALEKAHAMEFINQLDEGIHTLLSESGDNLSGGQRQRIALARALYKNPDILILDEATSALDNKSEALIQQALHELKSEMITFTVAHRLSTIEDADTILVFQKGEIICRGSHQTLLQECPTYQKLSRSL